MKALRHALIAVAGAAVLTGTGPAASAQEAASIQAVGWWTQRPGATALPEGGFEIAGAPSGAISEAALRVAVNSAQISFALLELTESSQVLGDVAGIKACPTTDAWNPANPGPWADAPAPKCESAEEPLSRSDTGLWTGDVSRLLRVGTVSIVLVGVPVTSDGAPVAFQTVFSGARVTASAPSSPTPPPATSEPVPFDPPDEPTTLAPPFSGPTVASPPATSATPAPATPAGDIAAPSAGGVEGDGETAPWWRLAFLVPLSIAAGFAVIVVRRTARRRGWAEG